MLEKMGDFFDRRLETYEEHQLNCIDFAKEFYPYSSGLLPVECGCRVLDLGCGTGLELEGYFRLCPDAEVTGIDLAAGMLEALKNKFPDKRLNLINGSYFDIDFGEDVYNAAISVESLHHFTKDQKTGLYRRLHRALKDGGYFILTDYFANTDEDETNAFAELERIKSEQNIADGEFYHFDTPLTVEHETQALLSGGFSSVQIIRQWKNTCVLKCFR